MMQRLITEPHCLNLGSRIFRVWERGAKVLRSSPLAGDKPNYSVPRASVVNLVKRVTVVCRSSAVRVDNDH